MNFNKGEISENNSFGKSLLIRINLFEGSIESYENIIKFIVKLNFNKGEISEKNSFVKSGSFSATAACQLFSQ